MLKDLAGLGSFFNICILLHFWPCVSSTYLLNMYLNRLVKDDGDREWWWMLPFWSCSTNCAYLGFLYHHTDFFSSKKSWNLKGQKSKTSDLACWSRESFVFAMDDDLVGTNDGTQKWLDFHPGRDRFSIFSVITTSVSLFFKIYHPQKKPRW